MTAGGETRGVFLLRVFLSWPYAFTWRQLRWLAERSPPLDPRELAGDLQVLLDLGLVRKHGAPRRPSDFFPSPTARSYLSP